MSAPRSLGLPPSIVACLFDLDGVVTQTAKVHAQAWKETFESVLHVPFDAVKDYDLYVDGKPREEGVRSFLQAKSIAQDPKLVTDIAERKDARFRELIHEHGVDTYPGTLRYIEAARQEGKKLAVVSSSRHTTEVLKAARLEGLFDAQVDGNVAAREHLHGKPAPDTYVRAAQMLSAKPDEAAVYEDALAGVEAGRNGHFGRVVGIDRAGQREELLRHGADVVVEDLAELLAS
ncbi:MAG TPA: beta-phosphoglucomutase family hydrolase [Candidatus Dormibacteraeota bacterium]|nr:beta-phosphoglucomutase family hydrolase [Candidatus Dormibacteraeota bacterium]